MFDWFFDFLYLLTRSLFRIIDALIAGTNLLCGIDPVTINGKKQDMMTWLLSLENVEKGFKITCLVGIYLVVAFTIWGILKNIVGEKAEGTPGQICMRAVKAILTFLFIPAAMYILTKSLNAICDVLYSATRGGADITLGGFLAKSFGQDCMRDGLDVWSAEDFDYQDFDCMWKYFNMRHYDYFFSWVAGIAILLTMTKVLFIFVERMFSIVLLYIISPIPVSASIIDEGQKFKAWRDQLLAKYCVGYGAILGLNIYTIVISALCTQDIEYFNESVGVISAWFLNLVFKLVIIVGGSFGLTKLVAMIGNLVANGAGDAAMADAEGMRKGVTEVGSGAAKLAKKVGGFIAKQVAKAFGGSVGGPAGAKAGGQVAEAASKGESGVGGGGGGGGEGGGGSGNKNPFLDKVSNGFKDFGNKVKSTFKGLFTKSNTKKGGALGSKGTPKGVTKTQGSNGGFKLGLSNNKNLFK